MKDYIDQLLHVACERESSDLHLIVGMPPMIRVNGRIQRIEGYSIVTSVQTKASVNLLIPRSRQCILERNGDVDFSYQISETRRFRINVYKQQGYYSLAIRLLSHDIPSFEELGLPTILKNFAEKSRGLVLITGATGSGKSTTLASLIEYINQVRYAHVITIEDPIEYVYNPKKCIVNQREVGQDTPGFSQALYASMREDPDIIMVGEMRNLETIQAAITAAETGHLVLSTLHTKGSASTINRILDVFPSQQQKQIRVQLANVLECIVTQNLLPTKDLKKRVLATEVLIINDAIRSMIRDEKVHQINSVLQTGNSLGMHTLDSDLARLVKQNIITLESAINASINVENLKYYL